MAARNDHPTAGLTPWGMTMLPFALIRESTDLTRQPSGLAANSKTIDGSHTATLKHEWPHEKGGFVRSATTNRTGGNDDTSTTTKAR
jgi:hypothetical protein